MVKDVSFTIDENVFKKLEIYVAQNLVNSSQLIEKFLCSYLKYGTEAR